MTGTVKQHAPLIWSQINRANRILMHCHPNPDPDSVGGVLALYHAFTGLGKSVEIIAGDSAKPEAVALLPGFDKISPQSWLDINISDYDLFLICDSASPSQITRKTQLVFPLDIATVVIDHHVTNPAFADLNLIDPTYPATCQIIADLLAEWGLPISKDIAICLILGIYADTGGQIYPPTSADTFEVMARLVRVCPDYHSTIFAYNNSKSPGCVKFLAIGLNNIRHYFSQQVAVSEITHDQLNQAGIKPAETEKVEIANYLISVKGWNIGVAIREPASGVIELSLRTRDPQTYPMDQLALALGGGGHPAAAGASLKTDFNSAKSLLLAAISRVFPQLGPP